MANINTLADAVSFIAGKIQNDLSDIEYENPETVHIVNVLKDAFSALDQEVNGYPDQEN